MVASSGALPAAEACLHDCPEYSATAQSSLPRALQLLLAPWRLELCPVPCAARYPIARWLHNDLDTTKLPEGSSDALDTNNDLHGAPDTTAAHAVTDDVKISKEEIRKPVADDGSGEQAALEDTDVDEETPKRVEDGMESSVRTSKAQKRQKHKSGKKADGDCQNSSENGSDVDFQSCGGASDADVEASA
mmetsp:Transcript_100220/g.184037  ORF Transcript_100220/g.184037 Transcript_100220/m.184037 type:complete len:190 (+) Transcript_100220:2278-2847(+)